MNIKEFFIATLFVVFFSIQNAYAADIGFTPRSSVITADSVSIDVVVTNNTQSINAVSGSISFPTNLLSVASISKSGSIISMWAEEPSYSNTTGTIRFEGVILNPGFSASSGKILTIRFVKKPQIQGVAQVSLTEGSVLANDGQATNVLGKLGISTLTIPVAITPPPITSTPSAMPDVVSAGSTTVPTVVSSTHPLSDKWYSIVTPTFSWELPKDVVAIKLGYGKTTAVTPVKLYTPAIKEKTLSVLSDGTYYFTAQFKTAKGFGESVQYKFNIDTDAPEVLVPTFDSSTNILRFQATDTLSGIDHYEIVIDAGAITVVSGETQVYTLPAELSQGEHLVIVRAVDGAGNSKESLLSVLVTRSPSDGIELDAPVLFTIHMPSLNKEVIVYAIIAVLFLATLWYSLVRFRVLRKKIRSDLASIEETLKDDFVMLREHLDLSASHISTRSKIKEKTEKMFKNSKDTIDIVERDITHKIEHLRKKV